MAAVTVTSVTESTPNGGVKRIIAVCPATMDDNDNLAITLANYGITKLWYVKGWYHSTANSVILVDVCTTSVTAGVLTITTITGSTDQIRVFEIVGQSN